jgi:uncharacterized protein (DUF1800 family)
MNPRLSRDPLRFWCELVGVCLVSFLLAASVLADVEEDFNSPTPILLSERNSTRALAIRAEEWNGTIPKTSSTGIFNAGEKSRIMFFVSDLALMDGEGANAFRLYLEDVAGHTYRFDVDDIQPLSKDTSVCAVTVTLYDKIGYNGQPLPIGDHLVRLTWRGLSSNRVRLGIGMTGGDIRDDKGAVPTSYPLSKKARQQAEDAVNAEFVGRKYSGDRTRFMEQATFGPTAALNDRLRRIGIKTYLAEQLEAAGPPTPYPNLPLMNIDQNATVAAGGCSGGAATCVRDNYQMYLLQNWFYQDAFYGDNQLQHRVAWSLSQVMVAAYPDVTQPSHMLYYQKILDKNAFGNFRNLMGEMTLNPGMGRYLDMLGSTRNNPNENYARELMQLFTVGLFMLNQDGTYQTDGMGNPLPTYDQETVNNFTEIFTGWQTCQQLPPTCPNNPNISGVPNYIDPMLLNQGLHNTTTKTLLSYPGAQNVNIPANQNGTTDLNQALDNIYNHPNVGPFVGKLLIQHLVTSDPTPAYVSRVAGIFNNDGFGNRGNLKAVVRAILLDPEARGDVKTDPTYGKLREPVQLMTNVMRQFGVRSANGTTISDGVVNPQSAAMAQNVYQSPSVFNYYSAEYIVPGTALRGPEFGILNTGTSIIRANFMNTIVFNTIPVSANAPNGTSLDLTGLQAIAAADPTCNQLLDELNSKMMHGTMSANTRNSILTATTAVSSADTLGRAKQALYLVATSSQYQVQR